MPKASAHILVEDEAFCKKLIKKINIDNGTGQLKPVPFKEDDEIFFKDPD